MKKIYSLLLWMVVVLATAGSLHAQQTIGAATKPEAYSVLKLVSNYKSGVVGGLRLPFMTTAQRSAISDTLNATKAEAKGLTIYNTDINCVEYWNDSKWISLCNGAASFYFTNAADAKVVPTAKQFPSTDSIQGPFTPHDVPACTNASIPYSVILMTGNEYTTLTVTNPSTGEFTVEMAQNQITSSRSAIVRVTDNCTAQYQDLIFVQQPGTPVGCLGATPAMLNGNGTTTLCSGGAVYLYLDPTDPATATGNFIWTVNNAQVASGTSYSATAPGTYIVYNGGIGCPGADTIVIIGGGSQAPAPVSAVWASNNGLQCTIDVTPINIKAAVLAGSTVAWYRNGILQRAGIDYTINNGSLGADITTTKSGIWFAAVTNGSCASKPSPSVTIAADPNSGTAVTTPAIGPVTAFCIGSVITLTETTNVSGLTYTWYANGVQIGTGHQVQYTVPDATGAVSISVTASGAGCSVSADITQNISANKAPAAPVITGPNVVCGTGSTLVGAPTGYTSYNWYKDNTTGTALQTGSSNQYNVTLGGSTYYLTVTDANGCVSPAASQVISNTPSNVPTINWSTNFTNDFYSNSEVYGVTMDYTPATDFKWTITPGTAGTPIIAAGGNGVGRATIQFPATGTDGGTFTLSVTGSNACGTSAPLTETVTLKNQCNAPTSATINPVNTKITSQQGVAASVAFTASAAGVQGTPKYQWYYATPLPTSTPVAITGATTSTLNFVGPGTGNYYVYATVQSGCGGATVPTTMDTVVVTPDPTKLTAGNGYLQGKQNFDVVQTGGENNVMSSRQSNKADFTMLTEQDPVANSVVAPFTGTQVYTFTPTAAITNLQFIAVDPSGIISSITPKGNYASVTANTPCKASIVYDNTLNTRATGLTNINPLKADIYAVYTIGATNYQVKLQVNVRDYQNCGVPYTPGTTVSPNQGTVWLNFMCHNLGADSTLDPFKAPASPNTYALTGNWYNFGNPVIWGVQDRTKNSLKTTGPTTNITAANAWNAGTETNPVKSASDPCPTGWRVATRGEWTTVANNTTGVNFNLPNAAETKFSYTYLSGFGVNGGVLINSFGAKGGGYLMLPMTGFINATTAPTTSAGNTSWFQTWASSYSVNNNNGDWIYIDTGGNVNNARTKDSGGSTDAMVIRCISQ